MPRAQTRESAAAVDYGSSDRLSHVPSVTPPLLSDVRILAAYLILAGSYAVFALRKLPGMKRRFDRAVQVLQRFTIATTRQKMRLSAPASYYHL